MGIIANKRNFLFEEVKMTAPERNGFDLSHENKQTCRAGKLYPFEVLEALPNDDFEIQVEQFIRLNPMLSPTMHRVKSYWHWFFCPNRLTWKYWEEFISRGNGKKLPANQEYTPPEPPQISLLTLLQYMPKRLSNTMYNSDSKPFYTGDYADGVAYLRSAFPEVLIVDGFDLTYNGTSYSNLSVVYLRTPRIANALSIPDLCFPFKVIIRNTSNQKMWLVDVADLSDADLNSLLTEEQRGYFANTYISLMPFVAAFRIWCEYYRDENLDDDYTEMLDWLYNLTGTVTPSNATEQEYFSRLFELNYRCWEKDYFTTATQLPQKSPDVEIPGTGAGSASITASSTISAKGTQLAEQQISVGSQNQYFTDGVFSNGVNVAANFSGSHSSNVELVGKDDMNQNVSFSHNHNLNAAAVANKLKVETTISGSSDSTLSPTTVAQVRRAFALQRWFEKVVRTGTRYIESLKAFFNSDAGDARLQRTEYIGGSSSPIQISDVVQTSATDDSGDTVQGNLAGYGMSSDNSPVLTYHAPEHGFVIGFFSILARTSYSQGIPRLFSRDTWLDYAWPEFEHIGEQAIKQKELAFLPSSQQVQQKRNFLSMAQDPSHIFGYQSRYSEYKQMPDRFGSGFGSTLDFWTLGRIFDNVPTLSKEFVHASVSDRNFAVIGNDYEQSKDYDVENRQILANSTQLDESYDYDTYLCDFWLDVKKVTSLTLYSEPI